MPLPGGKSPGGFAAAYGSNQSRDQLLLVPGVLDGVELEGVELDFSPAEDFDSPEGFESAAGFDSPEFDSELELPLEA